MTTVEKSFSLSANIVSPLRHLRHTQQNEVPKLLKKLLFFRKMHVKYIYFDFFFLHVASISNG